MSYSSSNSARRHHPADAEIVRAVVYRFHATIEVARPPVRGAHVILGLTTIREIEDPRVLQEAPDDADDADVLRQSLRLRLETADAAHQQMDAHAGL